MQYLYKD